ncbi:MAG: hypothetical protein Q8N47_28070 [Bryobacterales bacterium]|nr:hypothetical protein [Bryobacterales bacterium]
MENAQHNPVIRLLPSFTDLAFLLPIVMFLRGGGGPGMLEGDTGWHIRTGEWILANGRVPDKDIFSYTKAGEPWFAWEWLWDTIFAWLHQRGGMEAVVLASLLVICLTFVLVFRSSRRLSGNVLLAAVFTVLATVGSSLHWWARPHLVTLLFAAIFCWLLERAREGRMRLLWLLPLATVPWTNLHGGFLVGIVLALTYAAGELTSWLVEADSGAGKAALARARNYSAAAAGCLAASLVNPYFYRLHVHIYQYLTEPFQWQNIVEFQALNFRHPAAPYFGPVIFLGLMAAFWGVYRRRFTEAWLILSWTYLSLVALRNLPIFLVVATPILARSASEWVALLPRPDLRPWLAGFIRWFTETAEETGRIDLAWRTHLVSVLGMGLVVALFYAAPPTPVLRAGYDIAKYPVRAVDALAPDAARQRIFANDEWGDYLIYRLYPAGKVFVDGRSDFYKREFCEKYIEVLRLKRDWETTLKRHGVDTLLLPADASITAAVEKSASWRCVYRDKVAAIFHAAPGPGAEVEERVSMLGAQIEKHRGREVAQLRQRGQVATQIKR